MKISSNIIKSILAILLILCLTNMPYSYFQLVRFISFIGFIALAYQSHKKNREKEMIIYCILTLLFQPFFKVLLGRELWNVIDVVVSAGLIISIFIKPTKK
jgi:hypothetical protein